MWRSERDRTDDPRAPERETHRLARDEYDRPRYGSPQQGYGTVPHDRAWQSNEPRSVEHEVRGPEGAPWRRDAHEPRGPLPQQHEHVRAEGLRLNDIRVHEIMTRRVTSVYPATSVERAARLMEECDCGALPVVGDNGVLVGMVTDRDIAIRIVARGRDTRTAIVADCMSERVFACYANESLAECMRQMAHHQVRRMPIVDERGRLVGILSQGDLARHAGHHPVEHERRALADVVSAVSEPGHVPYR